MLYCWGNKCECSQHMSQKLPLTGGWVFARSIKFLGGIKQINLDLTIHLLSVFSWKFIFTAIIPLLVGVNAGFQGGELSSPGKTNSVPLIKGTEYNCHIFGCKNGGICVEKGSVTIQHLYVCSCPSGYYGLDCGSKFSSYPAWQ